MLGWMSLSFVWNEGCNIAYIFVVDTCVTLMVLLMLLLTFSFCLLWVVTVLALFTFDSLSLSLSLSLCVCVSVSMYMIPVAHSRVAAAHPEGDDQRRLAPNCGSLGAIHVYGPRCDLLLRCTPDLSRCSGRNTLLSADNGRTGNERHRTRLANGSGLLKPRKASAHAVLQGSHTDCSMRHAESQGGRIHLLRRQVLPQQLLYQSVGHCHAASPALRE